MFKTIVSQLAKNVWDSAASAPVTQPASGQAPVVPTGVPDEQDNGVDPEALGIELPYYPKVDTACGDACRCRWHVDLKWSDEHQCNATFVTWKTADDDEVCADCLRRRNEWQDVLVRLEER